MEMRRWRCASALVKRRASEVCERAQEHLQVAPSRCAAARRPKASCRLSCRLRHRHQSRRQCVGPQARRRPRPAQPLAAALAIGVLLALQLGAAAAAEGAAPLQWSEWRGLAVDGGGKSLRSIFPAALLPAPDYKYAFGTYAMQFNTERRFTDGERFIFMFADQATSGCARNFFVMMRSLASGTNRMNGEFTLERQFEVSSANGTTSKLCYSVRGEKIDFRRDPDGTNFTAIVDWQPKSISMALYNGHRDPTARRLSADLDLVSEVHFSTDLQISNILSSVAVSAIAETSSGVGAANRLAVQFRFALWPRGSGPPETSPVLLQRPAAPCGAGAGAMDLYVPLFPFVDPLVGRVTAASLAGSCGGDLSGCRLSLFAQDSGWSGVPTPASPSVPLASSGDFAVPPFAPLLNGTVGGRLAAFVVPRAGAEFYVDKLPAVPQALQDDALASRKSVLWRQSAAYDLNAQSAYEMLLPLCLQMDPPAGGLGDDGVNAYYVNGTGSLRRAEQRCGAGLAECTLFLFVRGQLWELAAEPAPPVVDACGPVSGRAIRVQPAAFDSVAGATQVAVLLLETSRIKRLQKQLDGALGSAELFPNKLQSLQPYAVFMLVLERPFVPWRCYGWFPKRTDQTESPFTAEPGPNFWSGDPREARLRPDGFHLSLNRRNGKWWASEMVTDDYFYYGFYYFVLNRAAHELPSLDPNVIVGLYVYEEEGTWIEAGVSDWPYREVDLEFGKFGVVDDTNAQFVVMPFAPPGNLQRYRVNLDAQKVTAAFLWMPDGVQFWAYSGELPPEAIGSDAAWPSLISKWKSTATTPWPRHNRVRINLWMWGGQEPQKTRAFAGAAADDTDRTLDGAPLVVHDFVHVPLAGPNVASACAASGAAVVVARRDTAVPLSSTAIVDVMGSGFSPKPHQNAVRLYVETPKDGRVFRLNPSCVVAEATTAEGKQVLKCRTDDPGVTGVLKEFGKSLGLTELGTLTASVSVCGGPWSAPERVGVVSRGKTVPCVDYRETNKGPQLPEPKRCKRYGPSTFCECPRPSAFFNFEGSDGIGGYGACAARDPSAARSCPRGLHRFLGAPTSGEATRLAANTVCLSKGRMPCFRHYPDCPTGMELALERYVKYAGSDPVKDRKEDYQCVCRAVPSKHYALAFSVASPIVPRGNPSDRKPRLATGALADSISAFFQSPAEPFCADDNAETAATADERPAPGVASVYVRDAIRALVLFTDDLFGPFPESWADYKLMMRPDLKHGGDFVASRVLADWRAIGNYSFGDNLLSVRPGSAGNTLLFLLGPKATREGFRRALGASFGALPNATRVLSWQETQEVLVLLKEGQTDAVSAAEAAWRVKVAQASGASLLLRTADAATPPPAPAPPSAPAVPEPTPGGAGRRHLLQFDAFVAITDVTDDPSVLYDTFGELYRPPETYKGLPWIPPVIVCGLIVIFTTVFLFCLHADLRASRREKKRNRRWLDREDLEVSAVDVRKISAGPKRKVGAGRLDEEADEEEMQLLPLRTAVSVESSPAPPSPGAASGSHVVLQMRRRPGDGDAAPRQRDGGESSTSTASEAEDSADESIRSTDVGDGIRRHLSLSEMRKRMRRLDERTRTLVDKPRALAAIWSEDGQPPPAALGRASSSPAGVGLPAMPEPPLHTDRSTTLAPAPSNNPPAPPTPKREAPPPYALPARPHPPLSGRAEADGVPVFGPEDGVLYRLQAVVKHLDEVAGFSPDVQRQAARLAIKEVTDAVEGYRDRKGDFEGLAVSDLHERKLHANREWFCRMSLALPGALSVWSRFVRGLRAGLTSMLLHVPTFAKYTVIGLMKAWRARRPGGDGIVFVSVDEEQLDAMLVNLYLTNLVFLSASNFRSCPSFLSFLFYAAKRLLAAIQDSAGVVRDQRMPPGAYVRLEVGYWHRVFSCAKMFRANTRSQQDYMTYSDLTELYELPRFVLDASKYDGSGGWGSGLSSLGKDPQERDAAIARRLDQICMDAWLRAHAIVIKKCAGSRLCARFNQKYYPEPLDYAPWAAALRSDAEYDKAAVEKAVGELSAAEKERVGLSSECRRGLARALRRSLKDFEGLVSSALDESNEELAEDGGHRIPLKLKQRLLELASTVRLDVADPLESAAHMVTSVGFRKELEGTLRKFVEGVAAELKKYDASSLLPGCKSAVDCQAKAVSNAVNELLKADDARFKRVEYRHSHVWLKTFVERSRGPLAGTLSLIYNTMPVFEIGCLRFAAHVGYAFWDTLVPIKQREFRLIWLLLVATYASLQVVKFLLWWWMLPDLAMCREVVKPRLTTSAASRKEAIDGLARWAVMFAIEAVVVLCDHFLVFEPLADANYFPQENLPTWQQALWIACIAFTCWLPTVFSFFISSNIAYTVILDLIAVLKGWFEGFERIKKWGTLLASFGAARERFWVRVSLSRRKSVTVRERCRAWALAWNALLDDLKERHLLKVDEYDRLRYRPLPAQHVDPKRDDALVLEHDRKYLDQMQNSTGPSSKEARRRIFVWASGLLMSDLPDSASLRQARSVTVLIPAGDEAVVYSEKDLLDVDASGICTLEHIIDMHPGEWTILVDELQRRADEEQKGKRPAKRDAAALDALRRLAESKLRGEVLLCWSDLTGEDQHAIRWWASMRFQPLARTLFGICSYFKAYDLLARMHYPALYDDPEPPAPPAAEEGPLHEAAVLRAGFERERFARLSAAHQDAAARERRAAEREALVASKVQVVFAYQNFQDRIKAHEDLTLVDDVAAKQRNRQPLSDDEKAIFSAWASWGKTLTDFKLKAGEVRAALLAGQGSLEGLLATKGDAVRGLRAQGGKLAEGVEERRKAAEAKAKALDNRLKYTDVCSILKRFSKMELVYIDKDSNSSVRVRYDPIADNARGPSAEPPPLKETGRVKMAGDPMLMYPKGENQNHALIFCENQVIQAIDCNQDFFVEEALKVPALLEEFTHDGSVRIVGFPEHVITTQWNLVARMSGVSERVFTTATQRALAMVGVRNHYGHPDYVEATYVRTNGGMSNTQYVSEDIFKGFDAQLTGGRIIQVEYMQGGKARDTSMLTTYKFMSKISQGAAQMSMAREFGYLLVSGNISFTKRTFLFNTTVTNFLTQGLFVKYGVLVIVLSRCIMSIVQPLTRWLALPNSFDLANLVTFIYVGFPLALPLLFENVLVQRRPIAGLYATCRDFVALSLYHSFHLVTFAVGFYNGLRSNAAYIPSGRGFGLQHDPGTDLMAAFFDGHLRYALFLLALIVGSRVASEGFLVPRMLDDVKAEIARTVDLDLRTELADHAARVQEQALSHGGLWNAYMFIIVCVLVPFFFNPGCIPVGRFNFHAVQLLGRDDLRALRKSMFKRAPVKKPWEKAGTWDPRDGSRRDTRPTLAQLVRYGWAVSFGTLAWLFECVLKILVVLVVSLALLVIGAVISVFRPGDPSKSGAIDRRTADAFRSKLFRLDERLQEEERARHNYYGQLAAGKVSAPDGTGAGAAAGSAAAAGGAGAVGSADGIGVGDREDGPLLGGPPGRRTSARGLFGRRLTGAGGDAPAPGASAKRKWRAATAAALVATSSGGPRTPAGPPNEPPSAFDEAAAAASAPARNIARWFLRAAGRRTSSTA